LKLRLDWGLKTLGYKYFETFWGGGGTFSFHSLSYSFGADAKFGGGGWCNPISVLCLAQGEQYSKLSKNPLEYSEPVTCTNILL
jgi:hypothetical protein